MRDPHRISVSGITHVADCPSSPNRDACCVSASAIRYLTGLVSLVTFPSLTACLSQVFTCDFCSFRRFAMSSAVIGAADVSSSMCARKRVWKSMSTSRADAAGAAPAAAVASTGNSDGGRRTPSAPCSPSGLTCGSSAGSGKDRDSEVDQSGAVPAPFTRVESEERSSGSQCAPRLASSGFPDRALAEHLTQSGTQAASRSSSAPFYVPPLPAVLLTTTAASARQITTARKSETPERIPVGVSSCLLGEAVRYDGPRPSRSRPPGSADAARA